MIAANDWEYDVQHVLKYTKAMLDDCFKNDNFHMLNYSIISNLTCEIISFISA